METLYIVRLYLVYVGLVVYNAYTYRYILTHGIHNIHINGMNEGYLRSIREGGLYTLWIKDD